MGKSQRDKGKRGERNTVNEIKAAWPGLADAVKRGWQAREGYDAPDVDGVPGLWIEVKTGRKPNPRSALVQAEEAMNACPGRADDVAIAVIRDDWEEPFVALRWRDFLAIAKGWARG